MTMRKSSGVALTAEPVPLKFHEKRDLGLWSAIPSG
jgi:hypothetical protein